MSLEEDSEMTTCWFESIYMKINADKCHSLPLGFKYNIVGMKTSENLQKPNFLVLQ